MKNPITKAFAIVIVVGMGVINRLIRSKGRKSKNYRKKQLTSQNKQNVTAEAN